MCQDNSCSMHQRSCWTQFARGLVLLISPSGTSWTTWQLGDSCACWMTGPRPIRAWLFTIPQAVMYRLDCARSSISFGRSVLDSIGRSEIFALDETLLPNEPQSSNLVAPPSRSSDTTAWACRRLFQAQESR